MDEMKISNSFWIKQLRERLKELARSSNPRLAILGIGNELNGDDSAGLKVVRKLKQNLDEQPNLFLYECGSIPENATGPLRKFRPGLVLLIDVADLDLAAGEIQWVDIRRVGGFSASSHTLPLSVLGEYLKSELGCDVEMLCIQPQSLEFGCDLSRQVKRSMNQIVFELQSCFNISNQ